MTNELEKILNEYPYTPEQVAQKIENIITAHGKDMKSKAMLPVMEDLAVYHLGFSTKTEMEEFIGKNIGVETLKKARNRYKTALIVRFSFDKDLSKGIFANYNLEIDETSTPPIKQFFERTAESNEYLKMVKDFSKKTDERLKKEEGNIKKMQTEMGSEESFLEGILDD